MTPSAASPVLRCYAVFHLNLAFSSIEEADRPRVVERCYWPLLEMVKRLQLPIAIEAPAYTLEAVAAIDRSWLDALRSLVTEGPGEFVGSGYAQIIGPLVPPEVVQANLAIGGEVYGQLLGVRPTIAFVNEQAWSASLARHYVDAGYRAVVMEWENPRATHPEWPEEWQYHPQRVGGQDGASIPVLWNHSIAFQKLQRVAHGELEVDEYLSYVRSHRGSVDRALCLYASDAEIFDYRPGRYRTEATLQGTSEWDRLDAVFRRLMTETGLELVKPSRLLSVAPPGAQPIALESPEKPIPVKKQPKYDLARWAITGRDDLGINTACWRAFDAMADRGASASEWRELCYLWSSDFRTHITSRRWTEYIPRLSAFVDRAEADAPQSRQRQPDASIANQIPAGIGVQRDGRYLTVRTEAATVRLNCRRGLALESVTFPSVSSLPLFGSVPHGYFDDIAWSADQYTGFLVLAASGQPQVTDLEPTEPSVGWDAASRSVVVRACITTTLGVLEKAVTIATTRPRVGVGYRLRWGTIPLGTLRLGHITLLPSAFDPSALWVATHNGGRSLERFDLAAGDVDHLMPVSHLVSCRGGFGATGGVVEIGDAAKHLRVEIDRSASALFPLLTMRRLGTRYFCRLTLSARELDETSRHECAGRSPFIDRFAFAIEGCVGVAL